jgi:hypothetical protein
VQLFILLFSISISLFKVEEDDCARAISTFVSRTALSRIFTPEIYPKILALNPLPSFNKNIESC